ncbi:hypothetical protein E05_29310 [Plautia stali symbiont]|nr:hypothetical protein E05_29310 [Plautia stali symbiont]
MMMKSKHTLLALLLAAAPFAHVQAAAWDYAQPQQWGDLSPDFHVCKQGVNQSPIDIRQALHASLPALTLELQARQAAIVNNGHTVQINLQQSDTLTLDGETFTLKQFHFHTPSENLIDGKRYPLEGHFVFSDEQQQLAVVGVMFEAGAANPVLTTLQQDVDITPLLPADRRYYRFSGSLTTPPCSEGVRWLVMKQPVTASAQQLQAFSAVLGEHGNSRPVQPLNGRLVVE